MSLHRSFSYLLVDNHKISKMFQLRVVLATLVLLWQSDGSTAVDLLRGYNEDDAPTTHLRSPARRELQALVSIPDIMGRSFVLGDMEAYLIVAGMANDMLEGGPFVFFPPWDDGWDDVDPTLIAKLRNRSWIAHLRNLIQYHSYRGELTPDEIQESQTLVMANGEEMLLTKPVRPLANNVRVIDEDEASNGYVYLLEEVLLPIWVGRDVTEQLLAVQAMHPTFIELLVLEATLVATLSSGSEAYTVFAPAESAFAGLSEAALNYLKSVDGRDDLKRLLSYHIVVGDPISVLRLSLGVTVTLTTLDGGTLEVDLGSVTGMSNTVSLTEGDFLLANNGIVHVIDGILLLDDVVLPTSHAPTQAPSTSLAPSTSPSASPSMSPSTSLAPSISQAPSPPATGN
jgi:uncharacterized surface protein with fasciclin (FAS1) repeats